MPPSSHPCPVEPKCTKVMSADDLGSQFLPVHSWGCTFKTQPRCWKRTAGRVLPQTLCPATQLGNSRCSTGPVPPPEATHGQGLDLNPPLRVRVAKSLKSLQPASLFKQKGNSGQRGKLDGQDNSNLSQPCHAKSSWSLSSKETPINLVLLLL